MPINPRPILLGLSLFSNACFLDSFGVGQDAGGSSQGGNAGSDPTGGGGEIPGGAGPGAEGDCFDARDGDGDTDIDCADADCADVAKCLPEVPTGWTLVSVEVVPAGEARETPCGTADATLLHARPAPVECTACECTVTTPGLCAAPEISCWFNDSNCTGAPNYVGAQPEGCSPNNLPGIPADVNTPGSCRLTRDAMPLAGFNCTTTGGQPVASPLFEDDVHVCADVNSVVAGCDGGTCGERVTAPARACIQSEGDQPSCPTGFDDRIDAFTDGTEGRTCSGCGCGTVCSGGSYIVRDSVGCTDYHDPVDVVSTGCVPTPNLWDYTDGTLEATAADAMMQCNGGEPSGAVVGVGPKTICCVPD